MTFKIQLIPNYDVKLVYEEEVDQRQEDGKIAKQLFYLGAEKNRPKIKDYNAQDLLNEIEKEIDR